MKQESDRMLQENLIFVKLGGSLITDKNQPNTPHLLVIRDLVYAIKKALQALPQTKVVLGHGSGSFGHFSAAKYNTHLGVKTKAQWSGFHEVWHAAHVLNAIVLENCLNAQLPVVNMPPSASIKAANHKITNWETYPIESALKNKLIPLIFGDVIFDSKLGGTIFSTEELFSHLAPILKPASILIVGEEPGIWQDYPKKTDIYSKIEPDIFPQIESYITQSANVDVTGGMLAKVTSMLELTKQLPDLKIHIFSGKNPENLYRAMLGESIGTLITVS